ncbi:MAG: hypothetical protein OWT27_02925 [Firmicutes bacterium]|nr:hypothetical protein [Bacillota bacterium]
MAPRHKRPRRIGESSTEHFGPGASQDGTAEDGFHRANAKPDALRVERIGVVNEEAIRSSQAQNDVLNPTRQKR